ncbi:hypothetical protein FEZ32_10025 [Acidipropionibacterium jensenii]|uniref:hypothetical protein n=1 Tax=Acidipropionibacterium jensenii TaxID=1749 RepID=UPI00110AA42C|nr:hypothetical protein [Acidipropionibacterium jensenii]QCV88645.1 hypothetical protein FEZ32_10025 [Acidipropionibacterium jensenii]
MSHEQYSNQFHPSSDPICRRSLFGLMAGIGAAVAVAGCGSKVNAAEKPSTTVSSAPKTPEATATPDAASSGVETASSEKYKDVHTISDVREKKINIRTLATEDYDKYDEIFNNAAKEMARPDYDTFDKKKQARIALDYTDAAIVNIEELIADNENKEEAEKLLNEIDWTVASPDMAQGNLGEKYTSTKEKSITTWRELAIRLRVMNAVAINAIGSDDSETTSDPIIYKRLQRFFGYYKYDPTFKIGAEEQTPQLDVNTPPNGFTSASDAQCLIAANLAASDWKGKTKPSTDVISVIFTTTPTDDGRNMPVYTMQTLGNNPDQGYPNSATQQS